MESSEPESWRTWSHCMLKFIVLIHQQTQLPFEDISFDLIQNIHFMLVDNLKVARLQLLMFHRQIWAKKRRKGMYLEPIWYSFLWGFSCFYLIFLLWWASTGTPTAKRQLFVIRAKLQVVIANSTKATLMILMFQLTEVACASQIIAICICCFHSVCRNAVERACGGCAITSPPCGLINNAP